MPEVSRFYGIVIRIFYDDHNPPHFHAEYGEHELLVNINTLAILLIGRISATSAGAAGVRAGPAASPGPGRVRSGWAKARGEGEQAW